MVENKEELKAALGLYLLAHGTQPVKIRTGHGYPIPADISEIMSANGLISMTGGPSTNLPYATFKLTKKAMRLMQSEEA